MALQKSAIEVPLGTGVNEGVQKELLDPNGSMASVQNLVVSKQGSFTKRRGFEPYPKTVLGDGTLAAGFSIHEYDQRYPVVTDGETLYDWAESKQTWCRRDRVSEVVVERGPGVQPPGRSFTYKFDSMAAAGVRVDVYSVPRGASSGDPDDVLNSYYSDVYYQLSDDATGAVYAGPMFLAQMVGPGFPDSLTLMVTNTHAVITGHTNVRNGSNVVISNQIQAWVFDLAQPQAAPVLDVWYTNATGQQSAYVRCSSVNLQEPNSNTIVYLYNTPVNPSSQVFFREFNPATLTSVVAQAPSLEFGSGSTVSGVDMYQFQQIQRDQSNKRVWVVWRDPVGAQFRVRIYDGSSPTFPPLSLQSSYTIAPVPVGGVNAVVSLCMGETDPVTGLRQLWVSWSLGQNGGSAAGVQFRKMRHNTGTNSVDTANFGMYRRLGVSTYSEPINRNGRWYQWLCQVPYIAVSKNGDGDAYADSSMRNLFLCEVTDDSVGGQLRPVANIAPRLISPANLPAYPHRCSITANRMAIPVPVTRNATSGAHVELCRASFVDDRRQQSAQFGDTLAFSGGVAEFFDGDQVSEISFLHAPSIDVTDGPYPAGPNPKGKSIAAGTYSCFAVWEHTDARGNVHQSGPSNIITRVFVDARQVWVTAHPLTVTSRQLASGYSAVRLVVYRTRMNEQTFFRDGDRPSGNVDTIITQVYWTEDKNQLFYTQPGVPGAALFRYAPPPLRCLIQHNGALCGVGDDGRTIWFSGLHLAGEGPWFNPAFVGYVDDLSPINALASMDGRLYAFTPNGIWAIDGNGFADNGEGGYGPPTRIAADAGCTNERSVVVTPAGILFQSELGIALLARSVQIQFFGRVVEDSLAMYPNIRSAVMVRPKGEVRYLVTGNAGAAYLSWNYQDNVWTVHRLPSELGLGYPVHAALVQVGAEATYHVVYEGGQVARESVGAVDSISIAQPYVRTLFETAWIKVAGLQGFQRVWRVLALFTRRGSAGLRISLSYDYDVDPTEVREWTADEVAALPKGEVEIHCARQKCTAIRVRVECVAPPSVTDGESHDYLGLRLIVGVKAKTPRGALAR